AQVLTPQSIAQMGRDLPQAARLLPKLNRYHGVGYGCTSGTTLIGPEKVAEMVRTHCAAEQVTNPLSAGIAALKAVGARRIGLVSPYTVDIAQPVRAAFEEAGFVVDRAVSFCEADERNVSRIDPNSLAAAAKEVRGAKTDAVFLSCTNLRTLDLIAVLEEALACPVISSNLALAWHLAQGLPASAKIAGRGRLFDATQPDGS
ncbi:MAG: aspartate/glutamate racemase family protein, partial [Pseudomonadota bacterium]